MKRRFPSDPFNPRNPRLLFSRTKIARGDGDEQKTEQLGWSKGHSHPAKKYIGPVFMFGHLSGNWIPDVLIAWNEPDRRSDGEKLHLVMTA